MIANRNSTTFNFVIFTVFTESNHSPYKKISNVRHITEHRTNEDQEFTRHIGAEYVNEKYPEGMLRGYVDIQSLFDTQISATSDPYFEEVKNAVENKIVSVSADFVFFPCSIGNHIEHRMLNKVGIKLDNALFYEDLPYAADFDNPILNEQQSKMFVPLVLKYENRIIQEKIKCLSTFYPSQVSSTELDKIKKFHSIRDHLNSRFIYHFGDESSCFSSEIVWGRGEMCQKLWSFLKENQ